MPAPLESGKSRRPEPFPYPVQRTAGLAALDAAVKTGIAIVSASTGYGLDDLVTRWVSAQPEGSCAWYKAQASDDGERFFRHAAASVGAIGIGLDIDVDAIVAGGLTEIASVGVPSFSSEIGASGRVLTLVISDVHRFAHPEAVDGLFRFLTARPANLRLILITTDDAAIELRGRRAGLPAAVVGESDLAVDLADTLAIARDFGIELDEGVAQALIDRYDGNPMAVLLSIETVSEIGGNILGLDAVTSRHADFIRQRIVGALSDVDEQFALDVSVAEGIDDELAEELTGRQDVALRLRRLREQHVLRLDADGVAYRMPWFVRDHLRHQRMSSSRSGTRVLERLAAVHYAERYQLEEAFSVLQRSADYETLIDLVLGHHLEWAATGRPDAVKQWCDAAILADPGRPELYLAKAGASLLAGDTGEAEASVSMVQMLPVDGDRATHIQGEVDMIYAAMHRQRGEFDRCCDAATRAADAVARLPDDYDSVFRGALPGSVPLFLGLAQFACGRVDEARVSLTAAGLDRGYAPVGRALIHGLLSLIAWLTDDPAARIQAAIAVSYVDELTGPGDFVAWCAYAIVGEGAEAVDAAAQVVALLDAVDEPLGVVLGAAVAALRSLDEESRRAHVARAVASIDACPEPGILVLVLRRTMETIESRAQDRVVAPTPNPATLTEGERRVVLALRGNMTEREIASELHLSHNTVRAYRRRAYRKLGVSSREEALQALWLESGDAPPA